MDLHFMAPFLGNVIGYGIGRGLGPPVYRHDPGPRATPDVATQHAAMIHTRRCSTRQRRRPICRVVAFALLLARNACSSADHQAVLFNGKRVAPTSPTRPAIPRIPAHAVKVSPSATSPVHPRTRLPPSAASKPPPHDSALRSTPPGSSPWVTSSTRPAAAVTSKGPTTPPGVV